MAPLTKWLRSPCIEDGTGSVAALLRHDIHHEQDMNPKPALGNRYAWSEMLMVAQVEWQVKLQHLHTCTHYLRARVLPVESVLYHNIELFLILLPGSGATRNHDAAPPDIFFRARAKRISPNGYCSGNAHGRHATNCLSGVIDHTSTTLPRVMCV